MEAEAPPAQLQLEGTVDKVKVAWGGVVVAVARSVLLSALLSAGSVTGLLPCFLQAIPLPRAERPYPKAPTNVSSFR